MATTYTTGIVTSTTTGTDGVWYQWMNETTASATTSTEIWTSWTGTGDIIATVGHSASIPPRLVIVPDEPQKITKDQFLRERRLKDSLYNNGILQRHEKRAAAIKAIALLKGALNNVQLMQLKRYGWFFVKGNESGKTYRIRYGRSGNVDLMENGRPVNRFCAHPAMRCPNGDTMLTQKIMLEHYEGEFLRKAVRH